MCVIFFAYKIHPKFPLVLLANRDEFYDRPTEKAQNWADFPNIFAGKDLVGGGTWLGLNNSGRFAAVTNYRQPNAPKGIHSRGNLTADFLKTDESAEDYLKKIEAQKDRFSGFNLIVGEINERKNELFYFSNRGEDIKKLDSGIFGLSNHLLDTPWQKVEKGKHFLSENLNEEFSKDVYFQLLNDKTLADDKDLPDTGIGYEREKLLSAIFIETPIYGTRCSSVLTFDNEFNVEFEERVFV
ncbi:MAG TPA: NRDE family protein [Pyrinomonadaceae bacterium]|nr:NRDE family protein [Pyrinomonadaceae bacterium]